MQFDHNYVNQCEPENFESLLSSVSTVAPASNTDIMSDLFGDLSDLEDLQPMAVSLESDIQQQNRSQQAKPTKRKMLHGGFADDILAEFDPSILDVCNGDFGGNLNLNGVLRSSDERPQSVGGSNSNSRTLSGGSNRSSRQSAESLQSQPFVAAAADFIALKNGRSPNSSVPKFVTTTDLASMLSTGKINFVKVGTLQAQTPAIERSLTRVLQNSKNIAGEIYVTQQQLQSVAANNTQRVATKADQGSKKAQIPIKIDLDYIDRIAANQSPTLSSTSGSGSNGRLRCNTKQALSARQNREKKKHFVASLEQEIERLKAEKQREAAKQAALQQMVAKRDNEIAYLRSVIANQSEISSVIRAVSNIPGQKIQFALPKQQQQNAAQLGDCLPQQQPSAARRSGRPRKRPRALSPEPSESSACGVRKGIGADVGAGPSGVCLHVQNGQISVELCGQCATNARSVASVVDNNSEPA